MQLLFCEAAVCVISIIIIPMRISQKMFNFNLHTDREVTVEKVRTLDEDGLSEVMG